MELHSSKTPGLVRLCDVLISVAILSFTTYVYLARVDFIRTLEAQINSVAAEPDDQNDDTNDANDQEVKAKPVAKVKKKPKPAPSSTTDSTDTIAQNNNYNSFYQPRGFQKRGFVKRGFSN